MLTNSSAHTKRKTVSVSLVLQQNPCQLARDIITHKTVDLGRQGKATTL